MFCGEFLEVNGDKCFVMTIDVESRSVDQLVPNCWTSCREHWTF